MDTYMKVRDILDEAQEFHRRMKMLYGRLAASCDRKRPEMLLNYLKDKEEEYEEGLAQSKRQETGGILETWMQFAPETDSNVIPSPDRFEEKMTLENIEAEAQRIREALIAFYETAAQTARPAPVRQLFEKLIEQHQSEQSADKTITDSLKHEA